MRNLKLVGFCGFAQSGKDTAANFLVDRWWKKYKRYGFGDKLKYVLMDLFGLTEWHLFTTEGKASYLEQFGCTVRTLLQKFGTDMCRSIYPTIWSDYVMRQIDNGSDKRVVIPDVRFEDEAQAIRDRGGVIIKIVREDYQELSGSEVKHASEALPLKSDSFFDYVIRAKTGELDYIKACVNKIVKEL